MTVIGTIGDMTAMVTAMALAQTAGDTVAKTPDAGAVMLPPSATYSERAADGGSTCGDDSARQMELYLLAGSPHARSPNRGYLALGLGSDGTSFTIDHAAPDAEGRWTLSGGRVFAVGVERQGVLDSPTTGHGDVVMVPMANGDWQILSSSWSDDRRFRPGDPPETVQVLPDEADGAEGGGRLSDGTVLRPFEVCPGTNGRR